MTTSTQMKKMYRKLEPSQQAVLVVQAAAQGDWKEVDFVVSQVQRSIYSTLDQQYLQTISSLQAVANRYGIEFWKSRAALFYFMATGNDEFTDKALVKLASVEQGLADVCTRLQVDAGALKALVGCNKRFGVPVDLPEPDAALVNAMTEELLTHVLA